MKLFLATFVALIPFSSANAQADFELDHPAAQSLIDEYWETLLSCTLNLPECRAMPQILATLEGRHGICEEEPGFLIECDENQSSSTTDAVARGTAGSPMDAQFVGSVFDTLTPEQKTAVQFGLKKRGHYTGEVDGVYGPDTFRAMQDFMAKQAARSGISYDMTSRSGVFEAFKAMATLH